VDDPVLLREDTGTPFVEFVTKDGLDEIATYANGIGPCKKYLYDFDTNWTLQLPEGALRGKQLISEAHQRRLLVHAWTVRNKFEDPALKDKFEGSPYNGS